MYALDFEKRTCKHIQFMHIITFLKPSLKLNVFSDLHISTANVVATGMADRPDGGRSENMGWRVEMWWV